MGHSHYWEMSKRPNIVDWEAFQTDLRDAIDRLGIALTGLDDDPDGEPEFTPEHVAFNGVEEQSAEDFFLQRDPTGFDCCKTYQRNYDMVVMVALIIADHHFGMYEFHATSDGSPKEWESALRFVREHFDYGDFPFDEDDIQRGFVLRLFPQFIEDYRRIRTDLSISAADDE